MKHEKIFTATKLLFFLSCFTFILLYALNTDINEFLSINLNSYFLVASVVLSLAFRYSLAAIWVRSVTDGSNKLHFAKALFIYASAWLGRYIPGGVFSHAAKTFLSLQHGVAASTSIQATVKETSLQLSSLFFLAAITFPFINSGKTSIPPNTIFFICIGTSLAFYLLCTPQALNFLGKLSRHTKILITPSSSAKKLNRLKTFSFYILTSILSNLAFLLFCTSIIGTASLETYLIIFGANIAVSALSIMVFFIPAGIGIREVGLLALISGAVTQGAALAIAVGSRLWTVVVDLIFFGLTRITYAKSKKVKIDSTS